MHIVTTSSFTYMYVQIQHFNNDQDLLDLYIQTELEENVPIQTEVQEIYLSIVL